jgi:beta-aspartyl-peptidase (threonine type)
MVFFVAFTPHFRLLQKTHNVAKVPQFKGYRYSCNLSRSQPNPRPHEMCVLIWPLFAQYFAQYPHITVVKHYSNRGRIRVDWRDTIHSVFRFPPMINKNLPFAFALHGGAGAVSGRNYDAVEAHLGTLTSECAALLAGGRTSLNVVEFAVTEMERSGMYVAGRGSAPNSAGYVELDASIMHGPSREAGAVAALPGFESPIQIARGVMEKTPHVLLAGAGARAFAREKAYAEVLNADDYYQLPVGVTKDDLTVGSAHGTVGAVACDQSSALAAATSTGGTFGKLEGRVGDTPLIGPGTWADDDIAISCTGTGEHIIRAGGAISIACAFKAGVPLDTAINDMLDEVKRLGGDAGVIAITRELGIATLYNSDGMKRASVSSEQPLYVATFA